jgi:lipopolysaccharide export LptBFGC system permease protein LptF
MHLFLFLAISSVALFSFLAVVTWSDSRRREREAFYKAETIRKITESQGGGGASGLEFLREEEKNAARRRREGLKLGGLVTLAVGISLMIFLRAVKGAGGEPADLVGLIPAFIGIALLVYVYLLAPKE